MGWKVTEWKCPAGLLLFVKSANTYLYFHRLHIFGSEQIVGNFCQVNFNAIPGGGKYQRDTSHIHHSFLLFSEGG